MARKTAEEGGLDAAAQQAEQQTREAALASQAHGQRIAAQQGNARTEVLSTGPIPEVKLGPAAGAPPVGDDADPRVADRFLLDPNAVAPVIGDATKRRPFRRVGAELGAGAAAAGEEAEPPREERFFAVLETKSVLDPIGGHRTPLRQGKVISDKHYDIVKLLRQGVRLKKVAMPTTGSDESLIDALTG